MIRICLTNLERELMQPTGELCAELGLLLCDDGVKVSAAKGDSLSIRKEGDGVAVTYQKKNQWFRVLTMLPRFLADGKEIRESAKYELLSYMADNSRNAVLNLPSAKKMIRYLAGMGYDSMMLYTEDTYEIPEYKYFGYMRGRFSAAELKELDDYADSFGLELIPCIQTLAHLTTALRWPDFRGYKDSGDILMVGDERTYRFVRAALEQCKACFRSRQINVGMDEAHLVACGEYLKKNGYRKPSDVMLEHLEQVVKICREIGFHPMIWSDMFFRMAHNGAYYIKEGRLPKDVVNKVPAGLELTYWDYYTMDRDRFAHMLDCHNQFKNPVSFAGGAWKWYGFGAHNAFSIKSTKMQLDLCEERGMKRIIVTGWGDDGGEASQFSNLASILYFAERCYEDGADVTDAWLDRRAKECLGISFDRLMAFDLPDSLPEVSVDVIDKPKCPVKTLLYNDLLERFADRHMNRENVTQEFTNRAEQLLALSEDPVLGYAFESLGKLCRAVSLKAEMGWRLYEAYQSGDKQALKAVADEIPALLDALREFLAAFRRQWYRENKTFGFTPQENRIGGLIARVESVKLRLDAYLNGEIDRIEELECEPLPYEPTLDGTYLGHVRWRQMVAAGIY